MSDTEIGRLARIETKIDMLLEWKKEHKAMHTRVTIAIFMLLLGTIISIVM